MTKQQHFPRPRIGGIFVILIALYSSPLFGGLGWGSHPVSDRLASIWVGVSEPKPKPVALAFFTGEKGWLEQKWDMDFGGNLSRQEAVYNQLTSGEIVLRVEVSGDRRTALVQDHPFSLSDHNVFLVIEADQEAEGQQVVGVGLYDLDVTDDQPLSVTVLGEYPELSARLSAWLPGPVEYLTGEWGWDAEGASCEDNPHRLEFSSDGSLALAYAVGVGDEPATTARYQVVGGAADHLRLSKDDETETDSEGNTIFWDLVLLDANSFCWHRSDWQEGACTNPVIRCSAKQQ